MYRSVLPSEQHQGCRAHGRSCSSKPDLSWEHPFKPESNVVEMKTVRKAIFQFHSRGLDAREMSQPAISGQLYQVLMQDDISGHKLSYVRHIRTLY